jgi:hypothetical protein
LPNSAKLEAPCCVSRIRIKFDKKKMTDLFSRRQLTAPDLYGMSGGALFSMPVKADALKQRLKPKLAGIMTHWKRREGFMQATTIEVVLTFIATA